MKKNWTNRCHCEGYIFNHDLQERTSRKGVDYIAGTINVATDDTATNVVPVHFTYVTSTYRNGNTNETYNSLKDIISNGITYERAGNVAWKVRIDGDVELNEWYTRDGELASAKRMNGKFLHIQPSSYVLSDNPANFEVDMLIAQTIEREVEDGDDYLTLRGYVFNFRNDILPIEFSVRGKAGMDYFINQDISNSNPLLTKVKGKIVSNIIKIEHEEESAFGAPTVEVTTRTLRAWDVDWAAKEPYEWDDESTLTKKELKELLNKREQSLAEMKKRNEEYQNSRNEQSGFPTQTASVSPSLVEEDDDDDLPF